MMQRGKGRCWAPTRSWSSTPRSSSSTAKTSASWGSASKRPGPRAPRKWATPLYFCCFFISFFVSCCSFKQKISFTSFTWVKCRTPSFLTSPFLPERALHTLGVGAATSWAPTRIFLSYTLWFAALRFHPHINYDLFQTCFQSGP